MQQFQQQCNIALVTASYDVSRNLHFFKFKKAIINKTNKQMKKIITIAAACMLNAATFGQVKFGVKAGGNLSNLGGCIWSEHNSRNGGSDWIGGFHAGGYGNYSFNSIFAAQAEVVFSMQGGKYFVESGNSGLPSNKIDGVQCMNYINIPLLLDIKPFKVPISFFVGPQFGYCVSRTYVKGLIVSDALYSSAYRDFDFAAALGIQYTFIEHLTVGLRANIGLMPSFDYSYKHERFDDNNNIIAHEQRTVIGKCNNVVQLSVGWTF
jgi:hypothetical protein